MDGSELMLLTSRTPDQHKALVKVPNMYHDILNDPGTKIFD
jgi:hypothetical protein